jgi:putative membrane protein
MKRPTFPPARVAMLLALVAVLLAGCSTVQPPNKMKPAPPVVAPSAAPGPVSDSDRAFLTQAAARTMYEAEISRLAASRAVNPRVRTYAQWVATRRTQADSELTALMRAKGVPRPASLPADKATKLQRLAALRPSPDFDLGYVRVVGIEDHQATIALFERTRRTTTDRDLQAWIDRMLPSLRNELSTAQDIAAAAAG